jgi:hypothetical protein
MNRSDFLKRVSSSGAGIYLRYKDKLKIIIIYFNANY